MEEEIPIEDNIENSINEGGWGDIDPSNSDGWGLDGDQNEDYENIQGGWDVPEVEKEIKELSIGDLFIVLLENREKPFLTTVENIFEDEKRVNLVDKDKKIYIFLYDDYNNIIDETEEYKALEVIKVKELENIDDYKTKREEIYFEVETKGDFEKEYSETRKKDDLLSHLIREYDCYDNDKKIEELYEIVQEIYNLIEQEYTEKKEKIIPSYLLPIFSNNTIDNSGIDHLIDGIKSSETIGEITYKQLIKQITLGLSPFEYKEGIGFQTDEYIGDIVKESSWTGDSVFDERKTKNKLIIPQDKYDKMNKIYTELVTIFQSDNLLISGLIEPKIEKQYFNYDYTLFDNITLFQKILIDEEWSELAKYKTKKLKDLFITDNLALDTSIKPDLNEFISHNFDEKLNEEKLKIILDNNLKSINEIINYIIQGEYGDKLLNIDDIHNLFYKYRLDYFRLDKKDKKKIDNLLEDNVQEHIEEYKKKNKRKFNKLKIRNKPLTDNKKVSLAKDYIFSLIKEDRKNELMKKFINVFTRNADKRIEDPNFLYNKFSGNKLLCKHYLYSCEIKNSNDMFDTLRSKFGLPPKEGTIYCKICGEYLCDEDFSTLEGFSDDKPIQSSEKIESQEEEQKKQKIIDKLEKKEDMVKHLSIISNMIGVQLEDQDIYDIILCYDYLDHNILADVRYKMTGITDTDIHERLNKLLAENKKKEKSIKGDSEKEGKKLEKLKKKKAKIIADFQGWIKDTNKILFYISIISLFIQTAVPVYRLRRDIDFKIIDKNEKINEDTIKYLIEKLKNIIPKYKEDPLFNSIIEVAENKDMSEISDQLLRTISYCNSTVFPIFLERKEKYNIFLKSQERNYLRQEWPTFKPLQNSEYVNIVNEFLKGIKIDDKLRKHYGKPFIENISIIRPLMELNEFNLAEKLALPGVSILQNSSFRKILRYTISCYGIHESNILMNLFFQNLLETTGEDSEKIKTILSNNGWRNDTGSFSPLSFKVLREKVIPQLFALYSRNNNYIGTCFNIEKNCNGFIHNSVNNYDLHQLNTRPKRIYEHILPIVYPNISFKDMNKDTIEKIFDKYRLNKQGDIIHKYDDSLYLNSYLLETSLLEKTIEKTENKELIKNQENFYRILEKERKENSLEYNPIIEIKNSYTKEDHYNITKVLSNTDNRFLKYLAGKRIELSEDKNKIKEESLKRLPNALTDPRFPPLEYDILTSIHLKITEEYILKLTDNKDVKLFDDYFQQIFSEYIKTNDYNISMISEFISENNDITSNQKKRFENVFSLGKRIKFNKENIETIFKSFISSELSYEDILIYMRDIQNIITKLNKEPNITGLTNKIPKEWNLTDSIKDSFMNFLQKKDDDENIKSNLLLHNRIFVKPRNDNYSGFNVYKNEKNHIYFSGLFNHISDTFSHLEYLKGNKRNLFTDTYSTFYAKYLLINMLFKIMEYIRGLQTNQGEIINDSMLLFKSLEERDEELIEESIKIFSQFFMDIITHLLFQHYDTTWLFMNKNKDTLNNRLSKQKEREKQENIEKVHNPSPEERYLRKLKQETGQSNWWKESSESAEKYVNSDDYASHSESERIERLKEIFGSDIEFDDIADKVNVDQFKRDNEENPEEDGYIGQGDLDEEGEEYLDDFDEEQEMEFNE